MKPSDPAPFFQPTAPATQARLLADVGGTNARFAWQAGPGRPLVDEQVLPCADHASLPLAIQAYLARTGHAAPSHAAVAIASPVTGDWVQMTNHHWAFSQQALRDSLSLTTLRVLNDFTALALALPAVPAGDLQAIGAGVAVPDAPRALLGAGTGLGVSGLVPNGCGGWVPLQGEGGHVTLPAETDREHLVMAGLRRRYGHVSAERALCGQGLLDMYTLLCEADGVTHSTCATPADITKAALAGHGQQAVEALTMFCALLGSVAGNLALTLGARGGVYVGGGIVPRLGDWFQGSPFRARFEAKGRYAAYLQAIPVWVITARQSPALLGASRALDGVA